ncbi:MAG: ABC transporter substrate-binding protein [Actinobacteria bacterium]|nr:MAG: ABC transporter substrate-binding protein [Actinomycetota bacterium]
MSPPAVSISRTPPVDGWTYVDTVSDGNLRRQALKERSPKSAAGPVGVAAYDIGRLVGEALARAVHLTGDGVKEGLEEVKRLPAATGYEGTTMATRSPKRSARSASSPGMCTR